MRVRSLRKLEITCGDSAETLWIEEFGSGRPVIAVTGGVHGNESIGTATARALIGRLPLKCGTVRVIAECNPGALRAGRRAHPEDDMDMNRTFPGNAAGSLTERLAAAVWNETADADFLIDLHGSAPGNLPYVLSVYEEGDHLCTMAQSIPMPLAIHSAGTPGQLFVEACRRRGQAALVLELPSDGDAVQFAEKVVSFLENRPCSSPLFCGRLHRIALPEGDFFRRATEPGQMVAAGACIGFVDDTPVLMPEEGVLVGIRPDGSLAECDRWAASYAKPR